MHTKTLNIGNENIDRVSSANNIGFWFDENTKCKVKVSHICRLAWMHLRNIAKIRNYLIYKDTAQLIHSFITNKLDSNNSLLYGIDAYLIQKLQNIQIAAAKLSTRTKSHSNINDFELLKTLHWLPVSYRITYKTALLTFKCLRGEAPEYLSQLLKEYIPSRDLRSAKSKLLIKPNINTEIGRRAFCYAAPEIWETIPVQLKESKSTKIFKSKLKTHFFQKCFAF